MSIAGAVAAAGRVAVRASLQQRAQACLSGGAGARTVPVAIISAITAAATVMWDHVRCWCCSRDHAAYSELVAAYSRLVAAISSATSLCHSDLVA